MPFLVLSAIAIKRESDEITRTMFYVWSTWMLLLFFFFFFFKLHVFCFNPIIKWRDIIFLIAKIIEGASFLKRAALRVLSNLRGDLDEVYFCTDDIFFENVVKFYGCLTYIFWFFWRGALYSQILNFWVHWSLQAIQTLRIPWFFWGFTSSST